MRKREGMKEQNSREKRKKIICDLVNDPLYVPMKEKELAMLLQVAKEDREELQTILRELLAEGKLMLTVKGKYLKSNGRALTGTFISNSKGFGFVEVEGREEDLFIPENQTNGAFHKDIVEVALLPGREGKRQEAQVLRIIARGMQTVVGTFERSRENYGFVVPDNTKLAQDIFVPKEHSKGAVSGHKVVVEITDYGTDMHSPQGKVIEILGHLNDPGVDILSIVRGYELPVEFPEKVMHQAARTAQEVSEADMAGRRDLRSVQMVTIDGEDAKDLDDAVSVSFDGERYRLGVHIADVANYVQENSALDREAEKRGTSVYLVDRVIPMLPHALSNGICSLNAGVDRLALSCLMTIDQTGEIVDHEICESVIRVDKRMSYTGVQRLLEVEGQPEESLAWEGQPGEAFAEKGQLGERSAEEGQPKEQLPDEERTRELSAEDADGQEYAAFLPMLREMEKLAGLLREKRRRRGSIDFDFPECKIYLDGEGHPTEILPYERNTATDIIEDFMLAANETVAQHFYWLELPFVYRVHDVPDAERLQKLSEMIRNFGYSMKTVGRAKARKGGEEVHPKEIQKLLARIAGTPEEAMISRMALRSMKRASYSVECTGHFGLACPYYCHFTSPIRRYPDLQIHRIIKEQLRGRMNENRQEHYRGLLPEVAKRSSELERRADEAERETDRLKKTEYMERHIGEAFEGVISGVTGWGIYVELPNTVEGLVHISKLCDDYYVYDEKKSELVGETTGHCLKLGMPVRVTVDGCDRFNRTIDFSIAELP